MNKNLIKNRAWIEVDLKNIENNINEIRKIIHKNTKIMAVVKANAYDHGEVEVSKKLNEIGILDFAVATLDEGIILRKAGIKGSILILGYTDIQNIKIVQKYDLIQTIVDFEYAKEVEKLNLDKKLNVHIKINTGMNRLGESYKNIDNLIKIYNMKNLNILGTFTHLCVSDSLFEDNIKFTKKQIDNFFKAIDTLKLNNINVKKIHIQASYGIINYNDLECDYVRPGIIMYGVYSTLQDKKSCKIKLNLKPALKLKSKIVSIRNIQKGESVGYGRAFIAKKDMKIATVSIGYADGYSRCLSSKDVYVLVNDKFAKIIGRICMDQMIVDVSNITNIEVGDIVTLLDDIEEISAENISNLSGSISNELLSRLGSRLPIIYN